MRSELAEASTSVSQRVCIDKLRDLCQRNDALYSVDLFAIDGSSIVTDNVAAKGFPMLARIQVLTHGTNAVAVFTVRVADQEALITLMHDF
jgi:hypothetical protein